MAARHQALVALWLSLLIDHGNWLKEPLRPAVPTLDAAQILDLVRLRLESLQLAAGVIEIELRAESCAATSEQLRLFAEKPSARSRRRQPRARPPARRVRRRTLSSMPSSPTAIFPKRALPGSLLTRVKLPKPKTHLNGLERLNSRMLVRRVCQSRSASPAGRITRTKTAGSILGPKHGTIDKLTGPYVFSGGWWNREIQREYYYAETRRGDFLWLYYDRVRRRWFLQGAVE